MEWIVESESLSDFVDHGWYTISSKPLVRCKDCREYDKWLDNRICLRFGSYYGSTEPDDYCSWGERKNESSVH